MNTKKILNGLLLGGALLFIGGVAPLARVAYAQEAKVVSKSTLAGVTLAENALLVPPNIIPEQLSSALDAMIKAGGPGVRRGKTEVLAWGGADYKRSRAPQLKAQMSAKLKAAGWAYTEGKPVPGAESLAMVSITKATDKSKGVIGYWAITDNALLLAWTEMIVDNTEAGAEATEETESTDAVEVTEAPDATEGGDGAFETPAPGAKSSTPPQEFQVPTNRAVVNVMKGVAPPKVTFGALKTKPGKVIGYVKDSKGRPLQGAVIGVRSSATGGFYSGAQGKSDAKGYYEIEAPWGAAEFYCAGYTLDYFDDRAAMGLHPADGEASQFATANGVVENWVLLPYGIADRDRVSEQPGYLNNYYGGGLSIGYFVSDPRFGDDGGLPDGSEIEVSLVPAGNMIDGTPGHVYIFHQKVEDGIARGFKIVNVPVGQYRLVAWLKHNGHPSVLKIRETGPKASQPFGLEPKETDRAHESALVTFRPNGATAGKVAAGYGNWDTLDVTLSR